MERTRPKAPLGPDEAQSVLRRAAELDRKRESAAPLPAASDDGPGLEAAELERVGAESGLSREAMRRALTELEGGALAAPAKPPALHRLVGGDAVIAEQTFDAPPEVIQARLDQTLQQSGLAVAERAPHLTRWEPAPGLRQTLGRAVNLGGSAAWVGTAIESGVHAVPGQRTSAELRGDARNLTAPIATVTGLLLAFPAAVAALVVLAFGLRWGFSGQQALALVCVAAAWMLLTALISRGVARSRVKKLRRALHRILAQVGAPAGLPVR